MATAEYLHERDLLRQVFPRGRFLEDSDGTCTVRARRKSRQGDHVFVQSPGKLLGVFYVGNGAVYRTRLGDLVRGWLKGDGEGILHVAWDPEVAKLLPWFTKKASHMKGRLFAATSSGGPPDSRNDAEAIR